MADPLPAPPDAAEQDRLLHEAAAQLAISIAHLDLPVPTVLEAVRAAINGPDATADAPHNTSEHGPLRLH